MAEFESCDKCKYNEKSETEYPCNQCVHNATDKFKLMTRADKIRSMSDEELAEFLLHYQYCDICDEQLEGCCSKECKNNIIKHLQSEAE